MTQLTVIAATALARAIRETTPLIPEIKWPNDILINGKKVAGVLTEMSAEPDRVLHAVIGIGLDVNLDEEDFPDDLKPLATLASTGMRQADIAFAFGRPPSQGAR